MASARILQSFLDGPSNNWQIVERFVCWINDTKIFDITSQDGVAYATGAIFLGKYAFSNTVGQGAALCYFGNRFDAQTGLSGGLYAAVAEIWEAPGHFVDWSVEANRYKFHASDAGWGLANVTYVPVDIGPTGARPGFGTPRLYLSGGPSQFVKNRAAGGAALTVNGDALVAIDDAPAF